MTFPKDQKKALEIIKRHQKSFTDELKKFGMIRDAGGKRYFIAPSYLFINDTKSALEYYDWFERNFPDDFGLADHFLCWALALYRANKNDKAQEKLKLALFENLYIFPLLFGEHITIVNEEEEDFERFLIDDIITDLFTLWSKDELAWAKSWYYSPDIVQKRIRYIEIEKILNSISFDKKRNELLAEQDVIAGRNEPKKSLENDSKPTFLRLIK